MATSFLRDRPCITFISPCRFRAAADNGVPMAEADSTALFKGVYDAGCRHFDTAEVCASPGSLSSRSAKLLSVSPHTRSVVLLRSLTPA